MVLSSHGLQIISTQGLLLEGLLLKSLLLESSKSVSANPKVVQTVNPLEVLQIVEHGEIILLILLEVGTIVAIATHVQLRLKLLLVPSIAILLVTNLNGIVFRVSP